MLTTQEHNKIFLQQVKEGTDININNEKLRNLEIEALNEVKINSKFFGPRVMPIYNPKDHIKLLDDFKQKFPPEVYLSLLRKTYFRAGVTGYCGQANNLFDLYKQVNAPIPQFIRKQYRDVDNYQICNYIAKPGIPDQGTKLILHSKL